MSRGGPSKLTPEVEKEILICIESGMPLSRVCEALGFTENALQKHRKKHPEFYAQVKEALVKQERLLLSQITVGQKNWQSAAWLLSKKYPHVYGRKVDEAPPVILPVRIITETVPDHPQPKKNEDADQEAPVE